MCIRDRYKSAASGSGIIVGDNDDELLIATNNHVVEGATTLSVCFIGDDVANAETETVNAGDSGDLNLEDAVSAKDVYKRQLSTQTRIKLPQSWTSISSLI